MTRTLLGIILMRGSAIRRACGGLLVLWMLAPSLSAQAPPPPTLEVSHSTPKLVAKAMGDILKAQKFKVIRASKSQIVLSQDRGSVAQATGGVMRVRLEMTFAVQTIDDSVRVWPVKEAYYGGGSAELERTMELDKEHDNFVHLFQAVKARLDSTAADSTGG